MTNWKKSLLNGGIALAAVIMMGTTAMAAELDHKSLNDVYEEEQYAETMYQIMVEKFDNDDYYQHLVEVMVTDSAKASSTERMQQVAETANFK